MINKVFLLGRLGKDPEVRSTPSGQSVATFTLATSRKWKDKSGQRQEQTEWHTVVCWGKTAEVAGQYLSKGHLVHVEGRLETQSWEDRKSGEKRYRTQIVCEQLTLIPNKGDGGEGQSGYQRAASAGSGGGQGEPDGWGEPGDDDIPFYANAYPVVL